MTKYHKDGIGLREGCCCRCCHINSHIQVRDHSTTGSSHNGAEEYPRENHKQPKVVQAYITGMFTEYDQHRGADFLFLESDGAERIFALAKSCGLSRCGFPSIKNPRITTERISVCSFMSRSGADFLICHGADRSGYSLTEKVTDFYGADIRHQDLCGLLRSGYPSDGFFHGADCPLRRANRTYPLRFSTQKRIHESVILDGFPRMLTGFLLMISETNYGKTRCSRSYTWRRGVASRERIARTHASSPLHKKGCLKETLGLREG